MKWQLLEVDGQREYVAVVPGGILQVSPTHKRGVWEAWHEPAGGVARQIAVIEKGGAAAAKKVAERYKRNMAAIQWQHMDAGGGREYFAEIPDGGVYQISRESQWEDWNVHYLGMGEEPEDVIRLGSAKKIGPAKKIAETHESKYAPNSETKERVKMSHNDDEGIPIANPDDAEWNDRLFQLQFGAHGTKVYVWAGSLDDAWEEAVEFLDDQKLAGFFQIMEDPDEPDMTMVGHATLTNIEEILGGGPLGIPSHEWHGHEVYGEERDEVRLESLGDEIRLGYDVYNVFQRYWEGQGDPLYAVLSRRGGSVEIVTIVASPEELSRLEEVAEEILESDESDSGERRTAKSLLKKIEAIEEEEED